MINYCWEIRLRREVKSGNGVQETVYVVAPTINEVLAYIAADLQDRSVELETVHRMCPVVAVLPKSAEVEET